MLQANNSPDALATPTPLEDAIDRFEDAWQQGGRPVIDDYLNGDERRPSGRTGSRGPGISSESRRTGEGRRLSQPAP